MKLWHTVLTIRVVFYSYKNDYIITVEEDGSDVSVPTNQEAPHPLTNVENDSYDNANSLQVLFTNFNSLVIIPKLDYQKSIIYSAIFLAQRTKLHWTI